MARLSPPRIASIAAWSAAAIAWGTVGVAVASHGSVVGAVDTGDFVPVPTADTALDPVPMAAQSSLPTMPERGLVVLRYTPVARPEPDRVVQTITVSEPAGAAAPTRTESSGS